MVTLRVLAALPSPPVAALEIGPLTLRAYGVAIAVGALVGVHVAQRRWVARGGVAADISALAVWVLPAGLVGARLYHVATDWYRFQGRWWQVAAVWEGGLGIPGGLLAGVLAGVVVARRRGLPVAPLLDAVAPAIPVAQAIGRIGNWFNQELYGRPTDVPWALRIDAAHRPAGLEAMATYHPTFLYEALWSLGLAGVLVAVDRRRRVPPGQLFVGYVAGYAAGRLWVEALRIDPATQVAGLRVNTWVGAAVLVIALVVLVVRGSRASSCRRAAAGVQAYLDGEVDDRTATEVAEHLETCRRCGMEADVYRAIKDSLARSGSAPVG